MTISLNLINLGGLLSSGPILLFQYLDGVSLVRQVWLERDRIFNHHICRSFHTSFELEDMEHIVNSQQLQR
jgi:hypothetical protein